MYIYVSTPILYSRYVSHVFDPYVSPSWKTISGATQIESISDTLYQVVPWNAIRSQSLRIEAPGFDGKGTVWKIHG
jgi:hypothetical protein